MPIRTEEDNDDGVEIHKTRFLELPATGSEILEFLEPFSKPILKHYEDDYEKFAELLNKANHWQTAIDELVEAKRLRRGEPVYAETLAQHIHEKLMKSAPTSDECRAAYFMVNMNRYWKAEKKLIPQLDDEQRLALAEMLRGIMETTRSLTAIEMRRKLGSATRLGRKVKENKGGEESAKARNQDTRNDALRVRAAEIRAINPVMTDSAIASRLAGECRNENSDLYAECKGKPPKQSTIRKIIAK